MKIYILTDLEGVAGISKFEHCNTEGQYYLRSCDLLTEEVNAAVEGALAGGVDEVVVWDGHGPGGINPEKIHYEAKLISGRNNIKYCGLDSSYDGMMIIGQHAMNRVEEGNLCHSYSSRGISRMLLNNQEIGEIGMRTIMAGFLDVPLILISGDDKACQEAKDLIEDVVTVPVKKGLSREDALSLSPEKSREEIKTKVKYAIENINRVEPYTIPGPYQLEIEYFKVNSENPDDRSYDRPIENTEVKKSENFLDIAW